MGGVSPTCHPSPECPSPPQQGGPGHPLLLFLTDPPPPSNILLPRELLLTLGRLVSLSRTGNTPKLLPRMELLLACP